MSELYGWYFFIEPCHKPQQCRIYWLYTGKGGGKNGTAGENLSEKCSTADSGGLCAAGAGHGVPGVCSCAPGAGGYGPIPADLIRLYGVCFAGFGGHQCGVHTAGCAVPDPWARHGPDAAQPCGNSGRIGHRRHAGAAGAGGPFGPLCPA